MHEFFKKLIGKKEEEMKSPEMLEYEERKATLTGEIHYLKQQLARTADNSAFVANIFFSMNPFIGFSNHQYHTKTQAELVKRSELETRLMRKEAELERLLENKPEKIHFEFKIGQGK